MVNLVKGLPEGWNDRNGITRSQELDAGRFMSSIKGRTTGQIKV